MWRYREVMPGRGDPVTPRGGEARRCTPRARLGELAGLRTRLFIKDESVNPTGSFKARGLSAAVTVARDLGARRLAGPVGGQRRRARSPRTARSRGYR